jgi:hypothetical protein
MRREISATPGEEASQQVAAEWFKENIGKGGDALLLVRFKKPYWNLLNNMNKEISIVGLAEQS